MPEKKLWTRHVGMEALNSVGSSGSCDSIESISSNHSAFSGDGYDHLSAEERECLMFLEETIGSLDNEDDSGLSNDELETTKGDSLLVSEPVKIPFSDSNEKTSSKNTALPNSAEWINTAFDFSAISKGHHSFPRVQVPKEESTKEPFDYKQDAPKKDQLKLYPEKPKRMSSINPQHKGESHLSEFLILPPPEAFRDPQTVDKRHSVTDPTDSREVRLTRQVLKSAIISEHKEAPATIKESDQKLPLPVFPRVSSPSKFITGEQEPRNQAIEKPSETQFKQGPPTAPKPRTLPPHIVIKTSSGNIQNLDPQKRPRTFSAHERSTEKANESVITTLLHSKEQETARHEALKKLGLEEKTRNPEHNSIPPSKTDFPAAPYGSDQWQKEAKRKSFMNQQEKTDSSSSIPVQPLVVPQKTAMNIKNEVLARNRLSMKTTMFEKVDVPASVTPLVNQKETHGPITSDIIVKTKHSEKASTQEKPDGLITPSLTDMHDVTDNSKYVKSDRNASQVNPVLYRKENNVTTEPDHPDSFLNLNQDRRKDFANLEDSAAAADNTEKHSFFSRPSRQSGPVTSVKIAPKGSTDEHRRQALKKLGILKE
ncbi:PREDICTED: specifically androgen-regulated gene protein [Nanorana parkeri]|uniref:specifically androgen-regulated gene protein n=1 Tax=Nanorana parkeri TaxID=125878 RepID=UPI000854E1AE|nr:PREDICTED: specifically androgen-regulated gene protein [Nanorana parkeri]